MSAAAHTGFQTEIEFNSLRTLWTRRERQRTRGPKVDDGDPARSLKKRRQRERVCRRLARARPDSNTGCARNKDSNPFVFSNLAA